MKMNENERFKKSTYWKFQTIRKTTLNVKERQKQLKFLLSTYCTTLNIYKGVSKRFRTGRLEREL